MDATLDHLVDRLRGLIGDSAGEKEIFDRDVIEEALNRYRYDAVRYPLEYALNANGSGAERVYSLLGWWAEDVVLRTGGGVVATPTESDFLTGSWSFAAPSVYPLYVSGRTFDLYAAAGDLLEQWAAKVKLEHDLSIGDLRLQRAQKRVALLEQAKLYRGKARLISVPIMTTDAPVGDYRKLTAPPPM
jgi:hypothetical protein